MRSSLRGCRKWNACREGRLRSLKKKTYESFYRREPFCFKEVSPRFTVTVEKSCQAVEPELEAGEIWIILHLRLLNFKQLSLVFKKTNPCCWTVSHTHTHTSSHLNEKIYSAIITKVIDTTIFCHLIGDGRPGGKVRSPFYTENAQHRRKEDPCLWHLCLFTLRYIYAEGVTGLHWTGCARGASDSQVITIHPRGQRERLNQMTWKSVQ